MKKIVKPIVAVVLSAMILLTTVPSSFVKAATSSTDFENDISTLSIEGLFKGEHSDDGRVAADKTVAFMKDDLRLFDTYDDNEFSVILSALGQSYIKETEVPEESSEKAHADVVFILDVSSSMVNNNMAGSTTSRLQGLVNSVNIAINKLKENDPDTRFGVVCFGNEFYPNGVYLPIDNYSLPVGETDYLLFGRTEQMGNNNVKVPDGSVLYTIEVPLNESKYLLLNGADTKVSSNDDRTLQRVRFDSLGNYYIYNANSNSSAQTGTIADNQYVVLTYGNSTYAIMRTGTCYTIYGNLKTHTETKTASLGTELTIGTDKISVKRLSNFSSTYYVYNNGARVSSLSTSGSVKTGNYTVTRTSSRYTVSYSAITEKTISRPVSTSGSTSMIATSGCLINGAGNTVNTTSYTIDRQGTYTQAGLKAAQDLFLAVNNNEEDERIPVVVLVSDGRPTYYNTDYTGLNSSTKQGTGSRSSNDHGYYTIRTAMEVKQNVNNHYTGQKALFYSIGPGITDQFGKTVLDPSKENLDKCIGDTWVDTSNDKQDTANADGLRKKLLSSLTEEQLEYVNFADWAVAGDMSETELDDAFSKIIYSVTDIPRPVTKITIVKEDGTVLEQEEFLEFTDTLGDGFSTTSEPILVYAERHYSPTSSTVKVVDGKVITTYKYSYTVAEESTGAIRDTSSLSVDVIDDNGKVEVKWYIPAALLPTILPNINTIPLTYNMATPIRLAFKCAVTEEVVTTNYYYTNDVTKPATLKFNPTVGNPYYYNVSGDSYSLNTPGIKAEVDKESNKTETLDYVYIEELTSNGESNIYLGNNGRIKFTQAKSETVVIDYGLDVRVHALANEIDEHVGKITGISTSLTPDTVLETAGYRDSRLGGDAATEGQVLNLTYGKASYDSNSLITYSLNGMEMPVAEVIYYEYLASNGYYYYASTTVVPATIIYYEDGFVGYNDTVNNKWVTIGNSNSVQDEDRPGVADILAEFDANNVYGYDSANLNRKDFSLDGAHKVTVSNGDYAANGNQWPSAVFTFKGTAFDLLAMTGGDTGFATVSVYAGNAPTGKAYKNWVVDTYYGYTRVKNGIIKHEWTYNEEDHRWHVKNSILTDLEAVPESDKLPSNIENVDTGKTYVTYEENFEWTVSDAGSIYQVPVIKSPEMPYGTYTVVVTPSYGAFFDHTNAGSYDFYIDAIRTYAPAEDYDGYNVDYYLKDSEAWPQFIEIRKNLISQAVAESGREVINGAVFIDSVSDTNTADDYLKYGPNNEVYLKPYQSVAFELNAENVSIIDTVQIGARSIFGVSSKLNVSTEYSSTDIEINSATDMYYKVCNGNPGSIVVVTNISDNGSYVSLTNIKITNKSNPTPVRLMTSFTGLSKAASIASRAVTMSLSECEHRFTEEVVTAPTEVSEGVKKHTCMDCGYSYDEHMDNLPIAIVVEKVIDRPVDASKDIVIVGTSDNIDDIKADGEDVSSNTSIDDVDSNSALEVSNELDEESLSWFESLLRAISDFFKTVFEGIKNIFK